MKRCKICFNDVNDGVSIFQYLFGDDCICGNCRAKFIENKRIYHYQGLEIHALYLYDDFLESLLFQYKEGRDIALSEVFFKGYEQKVADIFRHHRCVLMPSSSLKIQQRGFHPLKKMLEGIDVEICNPFEKSRNYKQSQHSSLGREEIHRVIQLKKEIHEPFIFFDDVVTTGNTLLAAAHLVRKDDKEIKVFALSVHPHFVELCDKV